MPFMEVYRYDRYQKKCSRNFHYINISEIIEWHKFCDRTGYRIAIYIKGETTTYVYGKKYFNTKEERDEAVIELRNILNNNDQSDKITELKKEITELKEIIKTLPVVCGTDYLNTAKIHIENETMSK